MGVQSKTGLQTGMKPSEPGRDQPSLAAYVEPSLPKPPAFSLCPQPHGSPEEVPSFPSCFSESFYYVLSPLKVSPYGKNIHMVLLPQSRTSPVSLSLKETLTLTGLAPCLSPRLATVSLFHFLARSELSGLWAFIYIGPLAEDFLESPASPAPSRKHNLLALLPHRGPLLWDKPPSIIPACLYDCLPLWPKFWLSLVGQS